MPVLTVSLHGLTAGMPPPQDPNKDRPAKRGACAGWTPASTRNNVAFLRSVRCESLDGYGYAITLTVKDCPEDPGEWKRLREAVVARLRRSGLIRMHWVTEWQRRGVPHLHAAIWTRDPLNVPDLYMHWLAIAGHLGARNGGQHVAPVEDALGWFQYVAKHSARGAGHYQRSSENVPESWRGRTGRIWGKVGEWDTRDPVKLVLDRPGWFAMRRIVKRWRVADARASGSARRIRYARRLLRAPTLAASQVRGVSEWFPGLESVRLVEHLILCGYEVHQHGSVE